MIKEVHFFEDAEEIRQAVERLKARHAIVQQSGYEHQCKPDICQPRNDARAPHVYVCKYGQVHVCLPGTCQLGIVTAQGEYVCPVSGLMLGCEESYTLKTEPHWKRVATPLAIITTAKSGPKFPTHKTLVDKTTNILEKLLFGKERVHINNEYASKARDACARQVKKYHHQVARSNTFIFQTSLEFIASNNTPAKLPYVILKYKEQQEAVQACVHNVCQLWERLLGPFYGKDKLYKHMPNAPYRPNVECLTIAMIYLMKTGRGTLIHQDEFLNTHLPREKDLPRFHRDGARHLKSSKDLIWMFADEATRLQLMIQYEPFEYRPQLALTEHEPSIRGYWCKRCRHRFEVLEHFQQHEQACQERKQGVVIEDRHVMVDEQAVRKRAKREKQVVNKLDRQLLKKLKTV